MISVDLDAEREAQLRRLAEARQEDVPQLVRRLLEEFLDVQAWSGDSDEDWARASVSMASKFMEPECWDPIEESDEAG